MKIKKKLFYPFLFSILFFVCYIIYFRTIKSEWFNDGIFILIALIVIYLLSDWILLSKVDYYLIVSGLMLHSFGAFGFYEFNYLFFGYDNIVHFYNSVVGGFVICDFLIHKLNIVSSLKTKNAIRREQKIVFFILIVSLIVFLGVIIEVFEFLGHIFLGAGEGLFLTGAGDEMIYIDTMTDIIVNFFGALVGCLAYFKIYKKDLWE